MSLTAEPKIAKNSLRRQTVSRGPSKPATRPVTGKGVPVHVRGLKAYYGETEAVKGINIDFPANQITAIIGPSGCGKSTLVRCINRMHEEVQGANAKGKVLLGNQDIYAAKVDPVAVRRTIGMVFQKPNPFPTMSILDNVTAGPRLAGTKNNNLRETRQAGLRDAGLWDEVKSRLNKPARRTLRWPATTFMHSADDRA